MQKIQDRVCHEEKKKNGEWIEGGGVVWGELVINAYSKSSSSTKTELCKIQSLKVKVQTNIKDLRRVFDRGVCDWLAE